MTNNIAKFEYLYSHLRGKDQKLYDAFKHIENSLVASSGGTNVNNNITNNFTSGYRISVATLGVIGDGVTNDTAAMQNAINTAAGTFELFIPFGLIVSVDRLHIPDDTHVFGPGSIASRNNIPSGEALIYINKTSNILFNGVMFDGKVYTPDMIVGQYGLNNNPGQLEWADGSTIRIKGNDLDCHDIVFDGCTFRHSGGFVCVADFYTTYPTVSTAGVMHSGNIDSLTFIRCNFINNRSFLMGILIDMDYGSWGTGIILISDCNTNNFSNVRVEDCYWSKCTGTCFWSHYTVGGSPPFPNSNLLFNNNWIEFCGLDGVQFAGWNGVDVIGNYIQVGFICYDRFDPTRDDAPARARWYRDSTYGLAAVCIDSAGFNYKLRFIGNVLIYNGEGISADGDAFLVCDSNIIRSAFVDEPVVDGANLGPWSLSDPTFRGQNYVVGMDINNTNLIPGIAQHGIIDNNIFDGNGYNSIGGYGIEFFKIKNNLFLMPPVVQNPCILMGQQTINNSKNNNIEDNTFYYPGAQPGIYAIFETPFTPGSVNVPFVATDINIIKNNILIGNVGEFGKDPDSSSTTGKFSLTSVTNQANGEVGIDVVVLGVDDISKAFQLYLKYNGTGLLTFTLVSDAFVLPPGFGLQMGNVIQTIVDAFKNIFGNSLTIDYNLCIDNVRNFFGNSISVGGSVAIDFTRNVYANSLSIVGLGVVINSSGQIFCGDISSSGSGLFQLGLTTVIGGIDANSNGIRAGGFSIKDGGSTIFGIGTASTPKKIGMKLVGTDVYFYDTANPLVLFLYEEFMGGICVGLTN